MALKLQIKTIVIRAIAVSALLTAAALAYCLIGSGVCSISTFFITADLQGRHFYRLGKYEAAAKRFAGLQWQAASFYRAGDFKQAAALYSGMSSAEGAFNHGNALVMLGKYEEAVKRTIELSGRDASGMAFAPLRFESNPMVSLYPAEPIVDDSFNRGALNGKRVESVTYVFTAEGMAELPEIAIPWWDIEKKKLQRAVLEALRLEIVPAPTAAGGGNGTGVSREQFGALPGWLLIILLTLAILLIPAVFFRRQIYSRWQHWQQARRERESFFFRQFVKSACSNDPKAAFNSLMRWLDRIHTGPGAARLDVFLNQYGNKSSSAEAGRLERALSEGRCNWTGKPLAKAMRAARQHWQKARQTGETIMSLPPLNPL